MWGALTAPISAEHVSKTPPWTPLVAAEIPAAPVKPRASGIRKPRIESIRGRKLDGASGRGKRRFEVLDRHFRRGLRSVSRPQARESRRQIDPAPVDGDCGFGELSPFRSR